MLTARDPALADLSRAEAARRRSSPRVRRLAAEQGVALGELAGTGFGGRVRPEDLAAFVAARGAGAASPAAAGARPIPAPAGKGRPAAGSPPVGSERIPAELLVFEVDMTRCLRWRAQRADEFRRRFGAELSERALVVWAAVAALGAEPTVNVARDAERRIGLRPDQVDVAVAMPNDQPAGDEAVAAPLLRAADRLSLVGVALAVDALARRAPVSEGAAADLHGATFAIAHGAAPSAPCAPPLLLPPQTARLTTTDAARRLVVLSDAAGGDCLAIRSVLRASLAYDTRVIGAPAAARFLCAFRRTLEGLGDRHDPGQPRHDSMGERDTTASLG